MKFWLINSKESSIMFVLILFFLLVYNGYLIKSNNSLVVLRKNECVYYNLYI